MQPLLLSFHINEVGVDGLSQLTIPQEDQARVLSTLRDQLGASEVFYLATCNRVEYALIFLGPVPSDFALLDLNPRRFDTVTEMIRHLLDVALSKDSVVFGENQIMGQMKEAIERLRDAGLIRSQLTSIFNMVMREAKAIRTEMGFSHCPTSVATVAGRQLYLKLKGSDKKLLLVGSGESHQIMGKYLTKRGFKNILWTNRTDANAYRAAREIGGEVLPWQKFLDGEIPQVGGVSLATHAGCFIFRNAQALSAQPAIVTDLSIPPNADHELMAEMDIEYLGLNEIRDRMNQERQQFDEIIRELTENIEQSVERICEELRLKQSGQLLSSAVKTAEETRLQALEEVFTSELSGLAPDQKDLLKAWSRKLVNKITHHHLETLKSLLKDSSVE